MKKQKKRVVYERPRCKVLFKLPFGIFIAKTIKIPIVEGALIAGDSE